MMCLYGLPQRCIPLLGMGCVKSLQVVHGILNWQVRYNGKKERVQVRYNGKERVRVRYNGKERVQVRYIGKGRSQWGRNGKKKMHVVSNA